MSEVQVFVSVSGAVSRSVALGGSAALDGETWEGLVESGALVASTQGVVACGES